MIKLRTMTAAYIRNGEDFLLMKRSVNKKFKPGIWAGVGGHLEPEEINNPLAACLREVYEETGISEKELDNIVLKYIVTRRSKDEIRIQYVYFADSCTRNVGQTDEGELHWINKNNLLDRELSVTTIETLKHYLGIGHNLDGIMVGTVSVENNQPIMNWVTVEDWEV